VQTRCFSFNRTVAMGSREPPEAYDAFTTPALFQSHRCDGLPGADQRPGPRRLGGTTWFQSHRCDGLPGAFVGFIAPAAALMQAGFNRTVAMGSREPADVVVTDIRSKIDEVVSIAPLRWAPGSHSASLSTTASPSKTFQSHRCDGLPGARRA